MLYANGSVLAGVFGSMTREQGGRIEVRLNQLNQGAGVDLGRRGWIRRYEKRRNRVDDQDGGSQTFCIITEIGDHLLGIDALLGRASARRIQDHQVLSLNMRLKIP